MARAQRRSRACPRSRVDVGGEIALKEQLEMHLQAGERAQLVGRVGKESLLHRAAIREAAPAGG